MKGTLDIWPEVSEKIKVQADSIKNPAFRGAFMKGVFACKNLGLKAKNPYDIKYQESGAATFTHAFRNYWNRGWNAWKKQVLNYCGIDEKEVKDKWR